MNNLERAKEIYFNYSSSKFQMMRDGLLEEYNQFSVTDDQEEKWLKELIERELKGLDISNTDTLFPLWYILQTNCLPSYVTNILDFVETKLGKADNVDLHAFLTKVTETVDRIEEGCKNQSVNMGQYRLRIESIKGRI